MASLDTTTGAQPTVPVLSPEQWRDTLLAQLGARQKTIKLCDDYYRGEHKMAFTTAQFREHFGHLFDAFADNWCDLVVDASAERLRGEGNLAAQQTRRRGGYGAHRRDQARLRLCARRRGRWRAGVDSGRASGQGDRVRRSRAGPPSSRGSARVARRVGRGALHALSPR